MSTESPNILLSRGVDVFVNDKAQDRKRCLKVVEVSVYSTKAHALCDTGAILDNIFHDVAKLSFESEVFNRTITVAEGVKC